MIPLVGVELTPEADEGEVRVDVLLEPGTARCRNGCRDANLVNIARKEAPESVNIMVESGSTGGMSGGGGEHTGELRIQLVPVTERRRSAKAIAAALRPKMSIRPGMIVRTRVSGGSFSRGSRSSSRAGRSPDGQDSRSRLRYARTGSP